LKAIKIRVNYDTFFATALTVFVMS